METIHLDKPTSDIRRIANATFPSYNGRQFQVHIGGYPSSLSSYWDGGSRSYYQLYDLQTGKSVPIPSNHPFFESDKRLMTDKVIEALNDHDGQRIVVVEHCIFCGKDMGIEIWAKSSAISKMLPAKPDISEHERIVLKYTSSLKNTYGGRTNIRFTEARRNTGITSVQWESAKQSCIDKGFLRTNGSITASGRNAI